MPNFQMGTNHLNAGTVRPVYGKPDDRFSIMLTCPAAKTAYIWQEEYERGGCRQTGITSETLFFTTNLYLNGIM